MTVYYVEEPRPDPVPSGQLWFAVGGSIGVWLVHLALAYVLAALHCLAGFFRFSIFGLEGVRFLLLLLTILAAGGIAASGWVAFRHWRRLDQAREEQETSHERVHAGTHAEDPTGRYRFMLLAGMLLSGLLAWYVIWSFFPIFSITLCPEGI